jgi:hypothetical protein
MDKRVERVDNNDDGVAGAVPEEPRSNDDTASSGTAVDPRIGREEAARSGSAGLAAEDPDAGGERKKLYDRGAVLVSRID